jgi:hypothetical protein
MIRSGWVSEAIRTASRPVPATATWYPRNRIEVATMSCREGSSSTTSNLA